VGSSRARRENPHRYGDRRPALVSDASYGGRRIEDDCAQKYNGCAQAATYVV